LQSIFINLEDSLGKILDGASLPHNQIIVPRYFIQSNVRIFTPAKKCPQSKFTSLHIEETNILDKKVKKMEFGFLLKIDS